MAKKSNLVNQFSDISGLLESASDKTDVILENSNIKSTFISTDVHILDALLSTHVIDGGIADDRITVFAGDPATGKSYICYNIARNAQKQGYYVIYIDTENACSLSTFEGFGVDVSKPNFQLLRIKDVETIKTVMAKFLQSMRAKKDEGFEVRKTIIFYDSIGGTASRKEIEDAIEGKNKQDMTRAKSLKSLFRIISVEMGYLRMPLVATNHVYMCLTAGHEILKSDGTYELIENIKTGDIVKTLLGDKPIISNVKYNNCPIIKITLENGQEIKCTPNHRFLVKSEWVSDEHADCWKMASELTNDDIILAVNDVSSKTSINNFKAFKVKKVELLNETDTTYDVQVEGSRHYFLKNGIVSHNTQDLFPQAVMTGGKGLEYSASVIVYLSSAKLKSDREDDLSMGQTGIIVSAKAKKNRLAKLKKIKFDIEGESGTNKYGGLDFFLTAENFEKFGIAKGKMVKDAKGVMVFEAGGQRSKWYVRHLDQSFYDKELYTSKVFTKEILEKLEPVVKDYFRYASYEEAQQYQEKSLEVHHKAEENAIDETFDIDVDGADAKLFD